MTYEMRMKDLRDEAHAEGLAEGKARVSPKARQKKRLQPQSVF